MNRSSLVRVIPAVALAASVAHAQNIYFGSRFQVQLPAVGLEAPEAAVVADFNQDGKPDIAIPNSKSLGIAILLGKGDGTLEMPGYVRERQPCGSIAAGDFDGDGNLDLAGVDSSRNAVFVLRGDGAGRFSDWLLLSAGRTPYRIAVADLNRDGNLDIVVTDRSANAVQALINQEGGRFRPPLSSPTGLDPTFLTIADFTGDSIPDIINVNLRGKNASLLAGNGDGTFLPPVTIADDSSPATVLAIDFNGDGKPDLVLGTLGEYLLVMPGNGDGSFGSQDWYPVGGPAYLVAGDVDGDGIIDLVGALPTAARLILMKGAGGGRFADAAAIATLSAPTYLALADLNGDKSLDIVTTSTSAGVVSVYLNTGRGEIRLAQDLGVARPAAIAATDLNADGKADVVVATTGVTGLWVMHGYGDGTLKDPVRYPAGVTPVAVEVADFNRDGYPDLAVANADSGDVTILTNKGDGTFPTARNVPASGACGPNSLAVADFNKDGYPDLVVGCPQGPALEVMLARGDGTFEAPLAIPLSSYPSSIATADFNADGSPDLAVLIPREGLRVYFGNGDGSFRGPLSLSSGAGCNRLVAADFNADDRPDLAATCGDADKSVLFLSSGSGSFRRSETAVGRIPFFIAVGDLNGDGMVDLAVMNGGNVSVGAYTGDGAGNFRPAGELGFPSSPGALAVVDLTGDRQAELVVCEVSLARVSVFVPSADGSPPEPPTPVSPKGNATVMQNDPSSSCSADPVNGSGFRLRLQWTPASSAVSGLMVKAQRQSASRAMVETSVAANMSGLIYNFCTFIADGELEGWQWWIRARDSVGNLGPWSPPAAFRFSPCRLSDGRACGTQAPPALPPPPAALPRMSTQRASHTATPLKNGKVLIAGGTTFQSGRTVALNTAELHDPATRTFSTTGAMRDARAFHTATALSDGRVIVAGGMNLTGPTPPVPLTTLEIYDPDRGTFAPLASVMLARNSHTATLLADGRVLLAGGIQGQGAMMSAADIFDPSTGRVTLLPPMTAERAFHTATLLRDGRVLIVGGSAPTAELFIPSTNSFQLTGSPLAQRINHSATALADGRVLLIGGLPGQGASPGIAEIFDPATGTFTSAGALLSPRANHTATLISGGRVLVLGGRTLDGASILAAGEVYSPATRTFVPGPGLGIARMSHTATPLADGSVLITGGVSGSLSGQFWLDTAEVVVPPSP